ncbi:hypothetical protein ASPCADRAFT_210269, partial [Aspergillus carbonarius ITEM 5010]
MTRAGGGQLRDKLGLIKHSGFDCAIRVGMMQPEVHSDSISEKLEYLHKHLTGVERAGIQALSGLSLVQYVSPSRRRHGGEAEMRRCCTDKLRGRTKDERILQDACQQTWTKSIPKARGCGTSRV